MTDAGDLARVERPLFQQMFQAVCQLDFSSLVPRCGFEGLENVGRQDIAADDGKVGRRVLTTRFLDKIRDAVHTRTESELSSIATTP